MNDNSLLAAIDESFAHAYESLAQATASLEDDEAMWRPHSKSRNVCELLAHITACKHFYTEQLREASDETPDEKPYASLSRYQLLESLAETQSAFRKQAENALNKDVHTEVYGMSLEEFLRFVPRHDTWHAGQIAALRSLYRNTMAEENQS